MQRRDFIRRASAVASTISLSSVVPSRRAADRDDARVVSHAGLEDLVVDGSDVSTLTPAYLAMLKQAGVGCCMWNGYSRWFNGLPYFVTVYDFLAANRDQVAVVKNVGDIRKAQADGKVALVLGWQSAEPLVDEPDEWFRNPPRLHLRAYYELGLRVCGIAYNLANVFGGGCLDPQVGLTRAGRALVEQIHRLGILLDVGGHTGEQTSLDAIAMSAGVPVICSHANAATLVDNPRNISDRLIEAIARTGGVIGITAVNDFQARARKDAAVPSTPRVSVDRMLDHVDHVKRLVGIDHVALGPDFTEAVNVRIDPETSFYFPPDMASKQQPINYVDGFERITELPNVVNGLRRRGWSGAEVRKLLGANWLGVYRRVWGEG